ncbi:MAG: triose-phosphate isomerase [Candidatus Micrarchaeota archaeon]
MKPRVNIGGNWKMNKSIDEGVSLVGELNKLVSTADCDVVIYPPATCLNAVAKRLEGSKIEVGAQMINVNESGAFTGQISIGMAVDVGCMWALVGHSETRTVGEFGTREEYTREHENAVLSGKLPVENDFTVNAKVKKALGNGLKVTMCLGETERERAADRTNTVVERQVRRGLDAVTAEQMEHVVLAYEPRWAIGKGKEPATPEQAQEVHGLIRGVLKELYGEIGEQVRIQYGGNVKPENIENFMKEQDINGALVGGASLDPVKFSEIIMKALI